MDMYSIENVIQESLEGIKGRSRPLDKEDTEETEFPEASEVTADNENLEVNELMTIDEKGKVLKETELAKVVKESPKDDSNPSIVQRMDVVENQVQILKDIINKYVLVDKTSVDKNGKWIDG